MKERIKNARPMMDLMAKKVFSNPEITAQFIRDILDLPVHHVKILDGTQIHNHQFEDIKTYVTSIDVLAELYNGIQVIIEILVAYQFYFIKRLCLQYKKVRWIEFFGNQPYTQSPERILEQADRIVSRLDWTKEERKMYDERTRYLQAYSSFLAIIEKDKKDARMEGIAEGIEKGKAHGVEYGKKMMIISLIKDGLLSKEEGAKRLSISVIELDEYLTADE